MGDPAGIGPEVCLKAIGRWTGAPFLPIVFGDAGVLERLAKASGLAVPPVSDSLGDAIHLAGSAGAAVFHIESLGDDFQPRAVSAATGRASYCYVVKAIEAALAGRASAIVTGPIHKEAL